jgi:NAD-dependent deacetylase
VYPHLIYPIKGWELKMGELCEKGTQLRPHIVWFGEAVPEMERSALITSMADIFIVIGTSLEVYPAAGLVDLAPEGSEKYFIDPSAREMPQLNITTIRSAAGSAVPELVERLLS